MTSHVSHHAVAALSCAAFIGSVRKPLLIAFALCAALPSLCSAQASDDSGPQTVIVTASRIPQAPKDVLSDNITITADEIQQSGQTSLVDLLQQKRGVEITATGGPGTVASVFIRGANSDQTIALIDGVRIGSSTLGGATWENIPLSQIDHIEIVYGPLSSLYGADAMGGVVQIFTKQGDGALHSGAAVGFGSYNTRTVDASLAGAGSGDTNIHYAFGVSRDESTGFSATKPNVPFGQYNPDKDGYDKQSTSGKISMDAAKGHELGFSFLQSRNSAQFDNGPGYDDHDIENLNNYILYSRDQFIPGWSSLLQLSQSEDKNWATNGPNWAAYGEPPNNTFDTLQTNFSWQNDFVIGSNLLQLIAERRQEKVDTDAGFSGERDTSSVAALYQWKSGNQLAVASIRNDDSNWGGPQTTGNLAYGSQTTGNLAYGYHVSNTLRINASLGTSFRAPTFNELLYPGYGNLLLKPEHGRNAETGLYYDDGKSHLSAVYYHNHITDLIEYDSSCFCAINVDHALLSGLSLGASTRLGSFALHGSLDFQDPRDETLDTILVRRAREHGSVGLDYRNGEFSIGAESIISGKRYDDDLNTVVLGGYAVLNLRASIDLSTDWTLFARWNNVLNKDYELAYGYATPGSNLFVGLRYGYK